VSGPPVDWQAGGPLRFVAGGATLEGKCHGPPPAEAATILMLHEGLGCLALWRDFPARLAAATGWGVFAWSRQGYGHSDPCPLPRPLGYMSDEALRVLPEVLAAIGLRRGILLGHSDGASIAAIYAGSVADHRVRGLVLMAPHFFTEPSGLAAIAAAKEAYRSGDLRARLAKYHADVDCAFRGWNDAWLDPAFAAWNITETLVYIRVPVLAIQGEADQYGTRAQISALEDELYSPIDVEMLADCRHAPHLDQPERTLAVVTGFVRRLARIEAAEVER
jgi:pimeloyl-ACP methyl ester carboxylesterase